ncbi:hypothetical protein FQN52_002071 [Onygenales sp. PD_12]|nr:hypothetical protein FQN52_002071 [Onygenales sp. PD_12]
MQPSSSTTTPSSPISDIFTNSLVMAGLCREHSPRRKRLSRLSRHTSSQVTLQHTPKETIQIQAQETTENSVDQRATLDTRREGEPVAGRSRRPSQKSFTMEDRDPNSPMPEGTFPPDFSIDYDAFKQATTSKLENTKHLFKLYIDILGEKEGMKCLQVVLSNPDRVIGTPRRKEKGPRTSDVLEVHGVEQLVALLKDERSSNQMIFRAYKDLPSPGVAYLSSRSRGLLLHRFANPPRRLPVHTERYLALIDDMVNASLYISPSLWTAAIHLAGKSYTKVKRSDLRSSIGVWRRMEHEGSTQSTSVTFNILYDIAIKAGQWKVADKIVAEMESRGLELSRFGRVARIYSHGLRQDAEGVRHAYHEFIQSGEVVDTVVLNCVMGSLMKCGEFHVAEQMYERMKDLHLAMPKHLPNDPVGSAYPSPSDNYGAYRKATKRLGRVLGMTSFLHDKLPEHHQTLQRAMPLTPDAKTFYIFLWHHAHITGDLTRMMALLEDMKNTFSIPPQGMVYIFLFHGFAAHGAKINSPWTLKRLNSVWQNFLRDLYHAKSQLDSNRAIKRRKEKFVWQSPLSDLHSHDPDSHQTSPDDGVKNTSETSTQETGRPVDQVNSPSQSDMDNPNDHSQPEDETDDDWRYENSVYLGRKIIVSCLRAHHSCGGPDAVLDVWARIDRLWKPEFQKKADMLAVQSVLEQLVPADYVRRR